MIARQNVHNGRGRLDDARGGETWMWVSKKQWQELEKRVADLEKRVQSQPLEIISALCGHQNKQMSKTNLPHRRKE